MISAIARFFRDIRWAWLMFRARRARRGLIFGARHRFDRDIRPVRTIEKMTIIMGWPDAIYQARPEDFARAFAALKGLPRRRKGTI